MKQIAKYSDGFWISVSIIILSLGLLNIISSPPSTLQTSAGTATIEIKADKSWIVLPSDCTEISWQIDGISALYIDGEGRIGADKMTYCPQVNLPSPEFEVIDQNNISRTYRPTIRYLLDEVLYALSFAGILLAGISILYYLIIPDISRKPPLGFALFLLISLAIGISITRHNGPPAPVIDAQEGDTLIYFSAEHSQALFPEECITIRWHVVNAERVTVNGVEQSLEGQLEHCQQDGDVARLLVDDSDLAYEIPLDFLFPHLDNTSWYAVFSVIVLIISAVIYLPLLARMIYKGWQSGHRQDFIVAGSLLLLAMVLYLPFGWSHVGHWEEWVIKAYVQGMPNGWLDTELRTRLFVIVPHILAHILTPNSFLGYNLIHMLMFFGKSLFLYGILRKLNLPLSVAFLVSALFMIYPVNSAIMSLRSFPMQFSAVSLLLAGYLILHLREHPSRLGMLGIWLALLFSVGSNESGYLIILIAPIFWFGLERRLNWKTLNLIAIWLMMPAVRLAFTFGLLATERGFYLSGNLDNMAGTPLERLQPIFRALGNAYNLTYPQGWADAVNSLSSSNFLLWSIIGTVIIVVTLWWLSHDSEIRLPLRKNIIFIIAGFIFLIPAVGMMISLDFYRNDTWRVFFYAPISGAVVMVGLVMLVVNRISSRTMRRWVLVILTCILFVSSLNRALNQHDMFVNHAIAKENFFRSLVNQAPALDASAQVIIISDLPLDDLRPLGLHELVRRDMLQSALFLLYDKVPPEYGFVCVMDDSCTADKDQLTIVFPIREIPYDELVIFHLESDLNLTLLETLEDMSGFPESIDDYQPTQLIQYDASMTSGALLLP